jgi:general secretion pathway protein E
LVSKDVKKIEKTFTDDSICNILLSCGLITEAQNRDITVQKNQIRSKLQQIRTMRSASKGTKGPMVNPVTIVDVIVSLNLERADDTSKILDEEMVFQALAKAWKVRYVKVDPLKLDMDLVTSIPHTFAMKHLVLPIGIQDGVLIVATPNPFNMEAIEDIAQVSKKKVKAVVSPKTDIIKLIGEYFVQLARQKVSSAPESISATLSNL